MASNSTHQVSPSPDSNPSIIENDPQDEQGNPGCIKGNIRKNVTCTQTPISSEGSPGATTACCKVRLRPLSVHRRTADLLKWSRKVRAMLFERDGQLRNGMSSSVMKTEGPPLRYSNSDNIVSGWLSKKGKRLGCKTKRFYELRGSVLSNFRNPNSRATWSLNIRGSLVLSRPEREIILVNRNFMSFYAPTDELQEKWVKAFKDVSENIEEFYDIGERIGAGAFSEVYIGTDKATNEQCAVNVIKRPGPGYDKRVDRELEVLRLLNHPNIVQIYDCFETEKETKIVMEYIHEGELLDIIFESGNLSERNSKQVLQDILQTVKYLHEKGIVHRDIKLENILCANRTWPLQIKLADFGLSRIFDCGGEGNDHVMRTHCGTQYYIAPEIANRLEYSESVDLWACGVVLYLMIAGKFPFYGDSNEAFILRLRRGLKFPENDWSDISDDAKSLVRGLLDPNPASRLTVDEALKHRWFVNVTDVVEGNGIRTQVSSNDQQRKDNHSYYTDTSKIK